MSEYVVGVSPNTVTFELEEYGSTGTYVRISSENEAVRALIGYDGISFISPVSLAVVHAIADALYALVYP